MTDSETLIAIYRGQVFGNGTVFRTRDAICTNEVSALLTQRLAAWWEHSEPVVLTRTGRDLVRGLLPPREPPKPMDAEVD